MAAKFDVSGLTLNPDEVKEAGSVIVERAFVNGRLSDNYDIQTGISHDQQIVFLAKMGIAGKALTSCTPAEIGGLTFTQKTWTPKLVAGRFTSCAADENQLFKILKKARNVYPDYFDRDGSPEMQIVVALILMSMEESIPAKVWFSDTAADDIAGGGVFANGTDLGLFNQFDGLWKQILADGAIPRHTISQNAGVSYAAQALAADAALAILKGVYSNADSRLKGHQDAKFYVTGEVYENFMDTVESKEFNGGIVKTLMDGRMTLTYKGIPVYKELILDEVIKTYQDNGTKWNTPHRVVLTIPENMPIGTLSESDLSNLRSIFDEPENTNIVDFGYFLDAKLGESYMTSVAY